MDSNSTLTPYPGLSKRNFIGYPCKLIKQHFFLLLILILFPFSTAIAGVGPTIFYTDITSGPNDGGENNNGCYLSIFGKNLGNDISKIKVYIGEGEVARYMHIGPSLGRTDIQWLAVQLGPLVTSGPIKVVVNGIESNNDHNFTVREGDIYFVALNGSDSSSAEVNNIAKPFRSPNYIRDQSSFGPGDFIVVRGGLYDLDDGTNNIISNTWFRLNKNGLENSPITFMGYPGEEVMVQIDTSYYLFRPTSDKHHFVSANFTTIFNSCATSVVIMVGTPASSTICSSDPDASEATSHGRIVNIEVDGKGKGAMCSGGSGNNLFVIAYTNNIKVLGVSVHDTGVPSNLEPHSHPIYFSATQRNNEVGWSSLHNIPYSRAVIQVHQDLFGGNCLGKKYLSKISIHDNIIHDVGGQPILLDGGTGDIYVYNNLIYSTSSNATYPDIIALRSSSMLLSAYLYNNTVYVNPLGRIISFGMNDNAYPASVTLSNNIFYVTDANDQYYSIESKLFNNIISSNNIWYGSNSGMPSFAGANESISKPDFIDPIIFNFQLQKSSIAINNGSTTMPLLVPMDIYGNRRDSVYDIGAFEFPTIQPPPAVRVK